MKRYLVIDDLGVRAEDLRSSVELINRGTPRIEVDIRHWVGHVVDPSPDTYRELARYDAFFVDFELATNRLRQQLPTFETTIGGQPVEVPVSTGLGVMHFLREVVATPEYRAERDAVAGHLPRERRAARVYAFVDIEDRRSQLYIGAAGRWFGAPYFRATTTGHLSRYLDALDDWTATAHHKLAARQAATFDSVLGPLTDAKWGQLRETYDALRIYAMTHGRHGALQAYKDAARDELGVEVRWSNPNTQLGGYLTELQAQLHAYLDGFAPLDPWPPLKVSENRQPLVDLLQQTSAFWTEPDVRWALLAHRDTQGLGRHT